MACSFPGFPPQIAPIENIDASTVAAHMFNVTTDLERLVSRTEELYHKVFLFAPLALYTYSGFSSAYVHRDQLTALSTDVSCIALNIGKLGSYLNQEDPSLVHLKQIYGFASKRFSELNGYFSSRIESIGKGLPPSIIPQQPPAQLSPPPSMPPSSSATSSSSCTSSSMTQEELHRFGDRHDPDFDVDPDELAHLSYSTNKTPPSTAQIPMDDPAAEDLSSSSSSTRKPSSRAAVKLSKEAEELCPKIIELGENISTALRDYKNQLARQEKKVTYPTKQARRAAEAQLKKTVYEEPVTEQIKAVLPPKARVTLYKMMVSQFATEKSISKQVDAQLLRSDGLAWARKHYCNPDYYELLNGSMLEVYDRIHQGKLKVEPKK